MSEEKQIIVTLTPAIYQHIENKFPPPLATQVTTDIQAGYLLGVQAVLRELRNEHTIPGSK